DLIYCSSNGPTNTNLKFLMMADQFLVWENGAPFWSQAWGFGDGGDVHADQRMVDQP
ncbi:hypothetical protein XENOCAPTIV_027461, partial [Xenoophorus captivus]